MYIVIIDGKLTHCTRDAADAVEVCDQAAEGKATTAEVWELDGYLYHTAT